METKLDLILKELEDLKLRLYGLKNKSKEKTLKNCESHRKNHNDSRREKSASRSKINEDDIIRRIKIDPLTFDDILNPKIFRHWMADLDYYFD